MSAADPAVSAPGSLPWPRNPVLVLLVIVAVLGAAGGGFVSLAPNRLVSGQSVMLWQAAGSWSTTGLAICGALLLALGFLPPRRAAHYLAAMVAGAALLLTLAAAGAAAAAVGAGASGLARVSLGAGFWLMFAGTALALIDALQRAAAGTAIQLLAALVVGATVATMAAAGWFDALSLAREYQTRRDVFAVALLRHIVLVAAAVGPAILIGVPLGVIALRRRRFEAPLFAVLNLLQTVPSIALFGLLLVPLSTLATAVPALGSLGIGGVGPAPAIIALVLYALLPVARNTLAGITGVSTATLDAARGMGMTPHQVFWRVEVPLALPVLLAGLRIVIVQAIGLAVVAALIGAGGLGIFVFEGLGQYAVDLVLLGALPAIVMALAVDFLLRLLTAKLLRATP
jgi:osmoprotectant transport system permease protein